jgi:hypothetical protein
VANDSTPNFHYLNQLLHIRVCPKLERAAGPLRLMRLVQSGTSYLSQDDMRLHFGLGKALQADALEVRWPDGTTSKLESVKANQILTVAQP